MSGTNNRFSRTNVATKEGEIYYYISEEMSLFYKVWSLQLRVMYCIIDCKLCKHLHNVNAYIYIVKCISILYIS